MFIQKMFLGLFSGKTKFKKEFLISKIAELLFYMILLLNNARLPLVSH